MEGRGWNRSGRALALVCLLLGLGACAGAGAGAGDGGSTTLVVENNLVAPTSLTVYVVPDVGTRSLVGVVTPDATATLRFDPIVAAGRYRFVAETTTGAEIVSNPVSFSHGATIEWDMSVNVIRVVSSG